MPRKYYPGLLILIAAGIVGILYTNNHPLINRLKTDTTPAIASLAFLGATGLLLLTATVVARTRRYRSLRTQLVTSFVIIVTIPTLLATVLSAISAYLNNEHKVLNVLETVSKLKKNQINEVINGFKIDAARISQNGDFSRNVLKVLIPGASNQATLDLFQS